ncbi:MAG: DUF1428 family protein [Candidatus Thermoplasmatota archaeon]|nr:DUF1428 family protein [Candidatus Thermoplasmatota archaeon]
MSYAALYLVPVPKESLDTYRSMANRWNQLFLDLGGIDHREWILEQGNVGWELPPIPNVAEEGEVLLFSVVECRDKAHYDQVMAAMMEDPRMEEMEAEMKTIDMSRMHVSEFSLFAGRRA